MELDLATTTQLCFRHAYIAQQAGIAEVVGSNPTRSIIITLGKYGIKISTFSHGCRTIPLAMPLLYRKKFDKMMFDVPRFFTSLSLLSYDVQPVRLYLILLMSILDSTATS